MEDVDREEKMERGERGGGWRDGGCRQGGEEGERSERGRREGWRM